jgi:hypothetical protein
MRFFRALPRDFKAKNRKKVCQYFMKRLTLQGGLDKEEPMWTAPSEMPTAGSWAAVRSEVDQNRLKYAGLPLDVCGEQAIKRVGAKWRGYLRWLHDLQKIEQEKALAVD